MPETDLPDPVKEDIANLQRANSELTNRVLELEKELRMIHRKETAEAADPVRQKI